MDGVGGVSGSGMTGRLRRITNGMVVLSLGVVAVDDVVVAKFRLQGRSVSDVLFVCMFVGFTRISSRSARSAWPLLSTILGR